MELAGKKIAFLGDSITEGAGVAQKENIYWNRLAQMSGAECYGYGIGGTRIAKQRNPSPNAIYERYFVSRVDEMIPDADIVVVFGGTNDFGHGDAPIGHMEDRTADTFYGGLHELYRTLFEKYPEAQLVVMTPTHRSSENSLLNDWNLRTLAPLSRYVEIIREVAEYYAIPVLDLFKVSGIQPAIPVLKEKYMPDGLHPNDAGHAKLAEKLYGFLKAL